MNDISHVSITWKEIVQNGQQAGGASVIKVVKDPDFVNPILVEIRELHRLLREHDRGESLIPDGRGRYRGAPFSKVKMKEARQRLIELYGKLGIKPGMVEKMLRKRWSLEILLQKCHSPYLKSVGFTGNIAKPRRKASPSSHPFTLTHRLPGSFESKHN